MRRACNTGRVVISLGADPVHRDGVDALLPRNDLMGIGIILALAFRTLDLPGGRYSPTSLYTSYDVKEFHYAR